MMFFPGFGGGVKMKGGRGGAAADVVEADYDDDHDDGRQLRRTGSFLLPKPPVVKQQRDAHHVQAPPPQKTECCSDEVNSRSDDAGAGCSEQRQLKSSAQPPPSAGGEVTTVGVVKRPRGRPPGSKNKPKTPPAVTIRDGAGDGSSAAAAAAMRPHVLEVADGRDVVDALSRFSRRHNIGLCVLAGTGLVSNVVLRQPPPASGSADISFAGHFEILSISVVFFPPSFPVSPPSALPEGSAAISITLAGPHGRVFGGVVAGPLTAVGTVTILAAVFCNPTYHRLPAEDDVSVSASGVGDPEAARAQAPHAPRHQRPQCNAPSSRHHQQPYHGRPEQRSPSPPSAAAAGAAQNNHCHRPAAAPTTAAEARGMYLYSCHLPSDVIWAPPAARSPPF